jgi:predicted aldo/keto reductase-like oxidoreductase
MGVIAMKVYSQGALLGRRTGKSSPSTPGLTAERALGYALSLEGVSTAVIGCSTPDEVDDNVLIAQSFRPFEESTMRDLEGQTAPAAQAFTYYKRLE